MQKKLVLSFADNLLIKPEINLIETILKTSSLLDSRWVIGKPDGCDAFLVGHPGTAINETGNKKGFQHISVARRGEKVDGPAFFRPIRAEELVNTLIEVEEKLASPDRKYRENVTQIEQGDATVNAYRLRRWPSKDILTRKKHFPSLASYLLKKYLTTAELADISGYPPKACEQFCQLLFDNQLLHTKKISQVTASESTFSKKSKTGFLSQIREKFGIGLRAV